MIRGGVQMLHLCIFNAGVIAGVTASKLTRGNVRVGGDRPPTAPTNQRHGAGLHLNTLRQIWPREDLAHWRQNFTPAPPRLPLLVCAARVHISGNSKQRRWTWEKLAPSARWAEESAVLACC
jgi:hypothetical protein